MPFMFDPLKKYAQFQGRARPAEFWQFWLFYVAVILVASVVFSIAGDAVRSIGSGLIGVFVLAVLIPSLAVTIRRLHDTEHSGWWYFISLIPLIGGIWLLILLIKSGTSGPNRFGPDPAGPSTEVFA